MGWNSFWSEVGRKSALVGKNILDTTNDISSRVAAPADWVNRAPTLVGLKPISEDFNAQGYVKDKLDANTTKALETVIPGSTEYLKPRTPGEEMLAVPFSHRAEVLAEGVVDGAIDIVACVGYIPDAINHAPRLANLIPGVDGVGPIVENNPIGAQGLRDNMKYAKDKVFDVALRDGHQQLDPVDALDRGLHITGQVVPNAALFLIPGGAAAGTANLARMGVTSTRLVSAATKVDKVSDVVAPATNLMKQVLPKTMTGKVTLGATGLAGGVADGVYRAGDISYELSEEIRQDVKMELAKEGTEDVALAAEAPSEEADAAPAVAGAEAADVETPSTIADATPASVPTGVEEPDSGFNFWDELQKIGDDKTSMFGMIGSALLANATVGQMAGGGIVGLAVSAALVFLLKDQISDFSHKIAGTTRNEFNEVAANQNAQHTNPHYDKAGNYIGATEKDAVIMQSNAEAAGPAADKAKDPLVSQVLEKAMAPPAA
jgi:hypothetical protein